MSSSFWQPHWGDWATYVVTSLELALAFPADPGGVVTSFKAFGAIFALTQIPLAIIEGVITALIFKYIIQVKSDVLAGCGVLSDARLRKIRGVAAWRMTGLAHRHRTQIASSGLCPI